MAWKKGPLPKDTYGWGGVVPVDLEANQGFFFADFHGDHVVVIGGANGGKADRHLKPWEVAFYNNSLDLPPHQDAKRLG